jgi:hypothetical protein
MRFIVIMMVALVLAAPAWSAPTVYFEPAITEVEQGQVFTVGIRVDAGTDTLTCFLVEFTLLMRGRTRSRASSLSSRSTRL